MEFAKFRRAVGANVRRARWLAGLTQIEASSEVITPRLLAEFERGQGNPTLRTLWALSARLGVSVRDLVEVGDEVALKVPLRQATAEAPKKGRKAKPRRLTKVTRKAR
ncbi:MAG: helix-turn-helix domain-containing protein [Polyangiaceae bacterium]|nr:helix-turn-helix domain-containing protein [Polyangiaceae bacterium]